MGAFGSEGPPIVIEQWMPFITPSDKVGEND